MADTEVTSSPRYLYYSDLHYIPEENKDKKWAAQCLIFSKMNNVRLVDSKQVKKFRDRDEGKIDAQALKDIFDPEGHKAEYVATDWKANPIYIHLANITEANLEKIPLGLTVKCVDEYAKLQQQKDNDKIVMRQAYINFLNETNAQLGYPLLKSTDDPYKYAEKMQAQISGKQNISTAPVGLVDNIKTMVKDNESMALYNEMVYKGDLEVGIEMGIQHYFTENKFARIGERLIQDIRNHNVAVCQYYTDKVTGRPVVDYIDPDIPMVSPFSQHDGEDITSWYFEKDITFRDFVRRFGKNKSSEDLKKIFERNKQKFASHGLDFDKCTHAKRDAAKIRIGYHTFLSQNYDVYSKAVINGNLGFKKMSSDWMPKAKTVSKYKSERIEKHYNVWYEHYYIPFVISDDDSRIGITDFDAQSELIFDFGKVQDQQRFGDAGIFSKPSLVLWSSRRMSFSAVMDRFMPKIDFLWQQFQNDIANAMPHGMVFAEELIQMMVTTADDSAKEGKDSKLEFMQKLKQTGYGITKMLNSDNKPINDGKPFFEVKTGHIASARERLLLIMDLYNMCRQSLGIDPVGEGVAPKPRQSLGGIQLALDAGTSANWYLEKGYMDMVVEIGNRFMRHIVEIGQAGDKTRLQQLKDVIGEANGMALEALKGIKSEKLGLSVENINTDAAKAKLIQIAEELVKAQMLDIEVLFLITKIDNYKYAVVLMILKYKEKLAQLEEVKVNEFNRQVTLKKMDIDFKKQDYINRADAESVLLKLSKDMDARLELTLAKFKSDSQQKLKEIQGQNKIDEHTVVIDKKAEEENKQKIFLST